MWPFYPITVCFNTQATLLTNFYYYPAGDDYNTLIEVVEFEPEETEKQVTVRLLDDRIRETAETFELYLTGGGGVHLSPYSRAVITITDNDGNC